MGEEMKKNEGTENQDLKAEVYPKNPLKRAGNWFKEFPKKHPRIWKGLKIGGCVAGAVGIGAGAYTLGKRNGQNSVGTSEVTDTFLPVLEDLPELTMQEDLVPIEELTESISDTVETIEA